MMDFVCPQCQNHVGLYLYDKDGIVPEDPDWQVEAWCTGSGQHKVTRMERVEPQPKSSSP